MRRRRPPLMMTVLGTALPMLGAGSTLACSVCFDGRDENRWAFILTTAFLSLLPLCFVGAVGWWLYRRTRAPVG